ncbi:hypothetical protein GY45DRAFT_1437639 [Cubamyces sp. BRFM 1775]|nr:hypothetical protein GY45DRAFT_1437639 [Cubamyces sp. BRFM 1775]
MSCQAHSSFPPPLLYRPSSAETYSEVPIMRVNAPALPLRPLPSIESPLLFPRELGSRASSVPRARTPEAYEIATPVNTTIFCIILGFTTCTALGLVNPVIGAALMPKYKALHGSFVAHAVLYAVLAGSSLVGTVTGIVASCTCLHRLFDWTLRNERYDAWQEIRAHIAKFFVLETVLFAFVAFVTGLGLVHHSHPFPEGMNAGDAVVMFWVGEAIMAPVLVCLVAVMHRIVRKRTTRSAHN